MKIVPTHQLPPGENQLEKKPFSVSLITYLVTATATMSQVLTVIGATGAQGSSVVNHALKDGKYKVRAITRNVTSSKAKALASRGVEVVSADINSEESLLKAFEVSVVFCTERTACTLADEDE